MVFVSKTKEAKNKNKSYKQSNQQSRRYRSQSSVGHIESKKHSGKFL